MIDPSSAGKKIWNVLLFAATVGAVVFIPLFLLFSFVPDMIAGYIVLGFSALVFIDIILEFRTGFYRAGDIVLAPRLIAARYLKRGFILDLLTVVPVIFLIVSGIIPNTTLFRLLALNPLLRLRKAGKALRDAGGRIVNPAIFRLFLLVFWFLLAAHLISCGWIVVTGNGDALPSRDLYVRSFYWTTTTLTTIGYGDITPRGTVQTLYVILIELFGAAMYGLVIGNIASLIANIDVTKTQYREKLDKVNAFMKYRSLPPGLRKKISGYYEYLWETRRGYNELSILEDLPMALKESVALHLNREIIQKVPLFEKAGDALIRDIILNLTPVVFTPGDYVVRAGEIGHEMYFISRGSVRVLSADEKTEFAQLTDGQFFGEMSLLLSMPRNATIRAREYCDLYQLDKETFERILNRYPVFNELIMEMAEKRKIEVEILRSSREPEEPELPGSVSSRRLEVSAESAGPDTAVSPAAVPGGTVPGRTPPEEHREISGVRAERSGSAILLVWDGDGEALSYDIVKKDGRTGTWFQVGSDLPRPVFTDSAPTAFDRYRIRAVYRTGPGPWSPILRITMKHGVS